MSDQAERSQPELPSPPSGLVWWLSLASAIAGLWWTLWPTLKAPFGMADDHNIIDMTAPSGRLPWSQLPETISRSTSEPVGRFRPLYWAGQAFESALWGRHSTLWYLDRALLATVTLVCLYLVLSRVVHPALAAAISLLPFSGPQVEAWTRLGPNEAYAMPLTAAGLALVLIPALRGKTAPRNAWIGYLLLALAGFAKENFLTIGPSVCLVMVILSWPRLTRRDWTVAAGVVAAFAVDAIAILSKVHRYGTLYPQAHTASSVARFLGRFAKYETVSGGLPIVLIALLVLLVTTHSRAVRPATLVAVGVLFLVVPQTYFNAGTSPEGRYLYPLVLSVVLLWVYAGWLGAQTKNPLRAVGALTGLLLLPLAIGSTYGRSVAAENATTATSFQDTISRAEAAADAHHTRTIIIEPDDPYWEYEPVGSYAAYLKAAGYRVATLPAPVLPSEASSTYVQDMSADISRWSAQGTNDLVPLPHAGVPCVSIVWGQQARRCSTSVEGYDSRPTANP